MNLAASELEPAVRDPQKLRRTAWILVGIMIVGGFLILKAYNKRGAEAADSDRPAIVYRIGKERDLRALRQDGKVADLHELTGKVIVVQSVALNQPETDRHSMAVMKRLADRYRDQPDFAMVSLVVDPLPDDGPTKLLEDFAAAHEMKLPQWWLMGTKPNPMHTFMKNQLKATIFPHQQDDTWRYDTSLVLIDRNRHIRRAVVPQKQGGPPYIAPFDFEQAAAWDAKGAKTGTELDNVEQLEALLIKTIDEVLAEPSELP